MNILDTFKSPLQRWLDIKNTMEMEEYIKSTIPQMIYNDEFLNQLVQIEFEKLIEYKKNMSKNLLYSA